MENLIEHLIEKKKELEQSLEDCLKTQVGLSERLKWYQNLEQTQRQSLKEIDEGIALLSIKEVKKK